MTLSIVLFFIGFYVLIKGADILIRGASSIARLLQISSWVIGVVIVGIGTSIPEFSVAFISAFNGAKVDIGLGTIIGSNTLNILLILGLATIVRPLVMKISWVREDLPINIAAVVLAAGAAIFAFFGSAGFLGITKGEGIFLLLLFLAWIIYVVFRGEIDTDEETEAHPLALPLAFGLILAGLAGVLLGGKWVVDGAEIIARGLGASDALIGLTIVGLGTSLPELVTSVVATWRQKFGIAVGNVIGSNIFDFLGILGFTAIFRPIPFNPELEFDIAVTILSAVLLFLAMFAGKKYVLKRWQGLLFILLYIAYIIFIIQRG